MSYGPVPGTLYVPNTYQEAVVFHPLLAQRVLGGMNGSTLYNRVVGPSCSWYTAETVPIPTAQARYIRTGMAGPMPNGITKNVGSDVSVRIDAYVWPISPILKMIGQKLHAGESLQSAISSTRAELPPTAGYTAAVRQAGLYWLALARVASVNNYSTMQVANLVDSILEKGASGLSEEDYVVGAEALNAGVLAVEEDALRNPAETAAFVEESVVPFDDATVQPGLPPTPDLTEAIIAEETTSPLPPAADASSEDAGEPKKKSLTPWLLGGALAFYALR